MKISKFVLSLIFVSVLTALLTLIFYNDFVIEKIVYYNMTLRVDDHFGLAVDNESLNFARVPPGQSAEKSILFANPSSHNVRILIILHGALSDWIKVSDYNFVLIPNDRKNVTFEIFAPLNASFGNYTGSAEIIFRKEFLK